MGYLLGYPVANCNGPLYVTTEELTTSFNLSTNACLNRCSDMPVLHSSHYTNQCDQRVVRGTHQSPKTPQLITQPKLLSDCALTTTSLEQIRM